MAQFCDRLTIDRKHRSSDGYLRVHAKAARAGIQDYLGAEVDPEGKHFAADQVVKVYRPAAEVFDKASMASFIGKPITDDHPSEAVTAKNWRDYSRGVIGGAAKDGEWLGFDLALMDATTIAKVDAGKCELSGGYSCDLAIESGTTSTGDAYQAVQRNIRGNHLAVVDRARAGSDARIRDGGNALFAACDTTPNILNLLEDREPTKMPHTLTIDGLQVPNVSDEAKAAIEKLQGMVATATTAKDAADAQIATLKTSIETKDGEIAALTVKLKDAEVTPEKLQQLADARASVVAAAKSIKPDLTADGKSDAEIRKEAVTVKLGDAAKDMADAAIEGAFIAFAKDAKPGGTVHNIAPARSFSDTATIRDAAKRARNA